MENLDLSGKKILVCNKRNCQALNRYGNDLCERRLLEENGGISIQYVGHTPPPAPPAEFLIGLSEEEIAFLLKERANCLCRVGYIDVEFISDEFGQRRNSKENFVSLTEREYEEIPRQEIGDESQFLCPKRRNWAKKSEVQKCVAVEHDTKMILVDHFGIPLNLKGEEIPLKIEVPLPGLPGSGRVIYYPNTNATFMGHLYFYKEKKAPEVLKKAEEWIFRSSPEEILEIGELEILILQKDVIASDCGHKSDISIFHNRDKIKKYVPGQNKYLLKPGEKIILPESFQGDQWWTSEFTFENRKGRLVKKEKRP